VGVGLLRTERGAYRDSHGANEGGAVEGGGGCLDRGVAIKGRVETWACGKRVQLPNKEGEEVRVGDREDGAERDVSTR
jgi:hypothetical protein